jgi:hypothetical protein
VRAIMRPLSNRAETDHPLEAPAKIGSIAARVLDSDTPIAVADEEAGLVGEVSREQIVAALFREGRV